MPPRLLSGVVRPAVAEPKGIGPDVLAAAISRLPAATWSRPQDLPASLVLRLDRAAIGSFPV